MQSAGKGAELITLVVDVADESLARSPGSRNVVYRPDLAGAPADALVEALAAVRPDVLITRAPVGSAVLTEWRVRRPAAVLVVVELPAGGTSIGDVGGHLRHRIAKFRAGNITDALAVAERGWHDAVCAAARARMPSGSPGDRSVALVGTGAVNLVTALRLVERGYQVELHDQAPDPRDEAPWTAYGCTRGGGDGRMFTLTEADSYNYRSHPGDDGTAGLLDRPVSRGGWLVADPVRLVAPEHHWADRFHRMPTWLADSYCTDILAASRAAGIRWNQLIDVNPGLFTDDTGYRDGILRLYTDDDLFRAQVTRNEEVNATRRVLTPDQISVDHPALADACASGTVVGGIEVVGFTVNIHKFVARLVDTLEEKGAKFHWNTAVSGIDWLRPGLVDGLRTAKADTIRGRHYVLSPGAYGDRLLRGTAAHRQIQGMLGVWLTLPNIEPSLTHSVKIARPGHRGEETNVTLATDPDGAPVLVCGAGYGWTGLDPENIAPAELDALYAALDDTLRRVFPRAHSSARASGLLDRRRLCVRPWTAASLGVFEQVPTADGGTLIVTGGHNTGGFAQAPAVADAVLDALEGRPHPMHSRYHPQRLERFHSGVAGQRISPAG